MGDPYAVYRDGEPWRRTALEKTWPGLYEVLAGLDKPKPAWGCALGIHYDRVTGDREYVPVAGRLWLNGTPACETCLKASDRPGGYPLERIHPDEWRRKHGA